MARPTNRVRVMVGAASGCCATDVSAVETARVGAANPAGAASASLKPDYVLFVGQAETRKDLPTLLAAMDLLPEMLRARFRLVVAGKSQPGSGARRRAGRGSRGARRVRGSTRIGATPPPNWAGRKNA